MTRILKTSGFAGLAVMMCVGLYQTYLLSSGEAVPGWLIGGHAHLGVLSILAVVVGFAIPALGVTGQLRAAITGMFVAGQWGLPLSVWVAESAGIGIIHATAFLWGALLVISMVLLAWRAAVAPEPAAGGSGGPEPAPADD